MNNEQRINLGRSTTTDEILPMNILDVIAPDGVVRPNSPLKDYVVIGGKYLRGLALVAYPKQVSISWLKSLYHLNIDITISMFIYPTEKYQMIRSLSRRQIGTGSNIDLAQKHGMLIDPYDRETHDDAERLRQQLARGDNKMFYNGFYICIEAHSLASLEEKTSKVEGELKSLGIVNKRCMMTGLEAFKSCIPLGTDYWRVHHTFTTQAMVSTNPLAISELPNKTGILLGQDAINGSLVILDPFKLQNANVNVLGISGAGKTFLVKMFITRELALTNTRTIIIDPEGEYRGLVKEFDGEEITFTDCSLPINPLEISGDVDNNYLQYKLDWLQGLFRILIGELDAKQKGLLEQAVIQAYKDKGITADPQSLFYQGKFVENNTISFGRRKKECPTLVNVYELLRRKEESKELADSLWRWTKGAQSFMFECRQSLNLANDLVVFNIRGLDSVELKTVATYIISGYCWEQLVAKRKHRIRLVVDESHLLLKYGETAEMIERFARQCRKYNAGLITISQNIDEFLLTAHGRAVASNSGIQVLLRQHETSLNKITEQFQLSSYEKQYLTTVTRGEALLTVIETSGRMRIPLKVILSPYELEIFGS